MSDELEVGDKVVRRTGRNKTIGVIERIYRGDNVLRVYVRWLGANRRRLGANSPDKYGYINISAIKGVGDE